MIRIILLLAGIILGASFFLPWWSPALCAMAICYGIPAKTAVKTTLAAFLAGFLAWGIQALYLHLDGNTAFTAAIANIFYLPGGGPLIAVTAFAGGILAVFGGLFGYSARNWK